jgi:tight adherence protein B
VPVALLTLAALGPRALALFGVAAVAAAGIADLVRRDRARGAASELRRSTVEMGEALAGEVRAGRAPADALARVAEQYPLLREPAETARLGGDVPGALRVLSQTPGADSLLPVAASWQLSTEAGASLAEALARSADQARADLGLATLVSGELASARATARLLAALPFLLLALGRGLGFDPWGFLLRSWPGIGCLTLGVLLALAGLRWVDQLGDQGAGP